MSWKLYKDLILDTLKSKTILATDVDGKVIEGDERLKLDQTTPQTITATDTTITASDEIYFGDATDSGLLKKDTVQGILDLTPAPDLSGYVPYTGATGDVDLGAWDIKAHIGDFHSTGFTGAGNEIFDGVTLTGQPQNVGDGQAISWYWASGMVNSARINTSGVGSGEDVLEFWTSQSNPIGLALTLGEDSSTFTGTISALNLSGINTGDEDLSGYLLNTTDTFVGTLSLTGTMNATGTVSAEQITSTDDISLAGVLTNTLGSADTLGINLDGQTNDYTGTATTTLANFTRDYTSGSYNTSDLTTTGMNFNMAVSQVGNALPNFGSYKKTVKGNTIAITDSIAHTGTNVPTSFVQELFGNVFTITSEGTYNASQLLSGIGQINTTGERITVNSNGVINERSSFGSGTLRTITKGLDLFVVGNETETAGSLSSITAGLYIDVQGTPNAITGSKATYGLAFQRIKNADAGALWGIYMGETDTGVQNLLSRDNQKNLFGTGKDASIYYDSTNLIINPKEVGSGILDIQGRLQTDGYNAVDGTVALAGTKVYYVSDSSGGAVTRMLTFKDGLLVSET